MSIMLAWGENHQNIETSSDVLDYPFYVKPYKHGFVLSHKLLLEDEFFEDKNTAMIEAGRIANNKNCREMMLTVRKNIRIKPCAKCAKWTRVNEPIVCIDCGWVHKPINTSAKTPLNISKITCNHQLTIHQVI